MSHFDDSDDDLMIPLSQRLGLKDKRSCSPHAVTLVSSCSSASSDEVLVVDQKDRVRTPLRRCLTLNDFSPVTKFKKRNTPIKPIAVEQKKDVSNLSDSFSSCLTLSSASCHSLTGSVTLTSTSNALHVDSVPYEPSSQVSSSSEAVKASQSSTGSDGRAPVKKISSRDCQALISTHFLNKHFRDEEIRKVFSEYECRFRYESDPKVDMSVTFVREVVNEYGNKEEKAEDQVIVMIDKEDLVRMVYKYKVSACVTSSPGKCTDDEDEEVIPLRSSSEDEAEQAADEQSQSDLVSYLSIVSAFYPDKNITFILTGVASYFRAQKKKLDESYNNYMRGKKKSNRKRKSSGVPSISTQDLNQALVDLQIKASDVLPKGRTCNHYVIERMADVLNLIAAISRSVAEAPVKKTQKEMSAMDWFAENDKGASIDLRDMERDVLRLWRKQLEQFPKVSREVADAIANVYPNANKLMAAYERLDEGAGRILLQDIPVGKKTRRVGPEIARKIHLFFTASDGHIFLGKDL